MKNNPQQETRLNEYYKQSREYLEKNLSSHDKAYFDIYINRIKEYATKQSHILDLGCGTGLSSHLLFKKNYTVTGVDISDLFLNKKYCNNKIKLLAATYHLALADNKFRGIRPGCCQPTPPWHRISKSASHGRSQRISSLTYPPSHWLSFHPER